MFAGLRLAGMVAPMVLDDPIGSDWLKTYVGKILATNLRPDDVVIMNSLSSHKRASVRELI